MGSAVIWQVPGKSARLFVGLDWIHLGLFYGEAGNTTEKKKCLCLTVAISLEGRVVGQ